MLEPPFRFDSELSPKDFQKIGQLSIRWSHIEFIIGHCLRKLLRLSHEEAAIAVFPLSFDQRIEKIGAISKIRPLRPEAERAYRELVWVKPYIQLVRNNVLHAFVDIGEDGGHTFFNRATGRKLTKADIFSIEEITNYAAHAALSLRYAIGLNVDPTLRHPLPDRPALPAFLSGGIPPRRLDKDGGSKAPAFPHQASDT